MPIACLNDGPSDASARLVLAHGAGAPMDSSSMQALASRVAGFGIGVTRFEFPYMEARRLTGKRPGPDPQPVLRARYREVIEQLGGASELVIGGRSMGGRIASLIADEVSVRGLCCVGYPFHPAGRPEVTRTAHLATLRTPTLIVQGTRDALGSREEVLGYTLCRAIEVAFIEDGDHALKPRKRSGRTEAQALDEAAQRIARFVLERFAAA